MNPFGGTVDISSLHLWEVMTQAMQNVRMTEFYMGFVYVATGERR